MPQIVKHSCGAVLFESRTEIVSMDEIVAKYFGKCPKCGGKLNFCDFKIDVKPNGRR